MGTIPFHISDRFCLFYKLVQADLKNFYYFF